MKALKKLIYTWIDKLFLRGCSSYNPLEVRKSCRSKEQARAVFAANGIPHARGEIFFSPLRAYRFARTHGFPLVIKPNVSGFSRGSHFPINSFRELWKASLMVKIWWPWSVVEEYLQGRNYRVLVGNGEIISVIRRYPPFVTGDGQSSISQLIDRENQVREKMGLYPVIHPIPKNRAIRRYLGKQGLNLNSIPGADEEVILFNRISLAPGGVVETIDTRNIPEINQRLFKRILELFNANILGIDVIMEQGIEIPWNEQKCIFLEVNSRPFTAMHTVPRFGPQQDLSQAFENLDALNIDNRDIF
ncbi:cyanophycin synthetase [Thiolapillus brandeum]|uniref:Cyanophycin synthetase n=1 Tax=Thiolapillus brandeum TaxID=1076588 RepID=A0A7U6GJD1_9GAMM|nr:cyanophycin synthetase [Thiolapillus brandeum]BAO44778.1 cyanophycin synthetase [Thiolapillus brandeum]